MNSNDAPNDSPRDGLIRSGVATLLFALWHSLLAGSAVKDRLRQRDEEKFIAYYRVFYIVQSLVTTGALLIYVLRQPGKTLYEARGWKRNVLRLGQLVSIGYGAWGAMQLPLTHFSGLPHLLAHLTGKKMPREPEAQGPTVLEDNSVHTTGPFKFSRHPLNLAPLGVFWLQPKMTTNWLIFNILVTIYDLIGSKNEEKRLAEASPEYEEYRRRTPFFWPRRTFKS